MWTPVSYRVLVAENKNIYHIKKKKYIKNPRSEQSSRKEEEGGRRRSMGVAAAGMATYLARRAAQRERVRILYRKALKDTLNWAVHRHIFYQDVLIFISPLISLVFFFCGRIFFQMFTY